MEPSILYRRNAPPVTVMKATISTKTPAYPPHVFQTRVLTDSSSISKLRKIRRIPDPNSQCHPHRPLRVTEMESCGATQTNSRTVTVNHQPHLRLRTSPHTHTLKTAPKQTPLNMPRPRPALPPPLKPRPKQPALITVMCHASSSTETNFIQSLPHRHQSKTRRFTRIPWNLIIYPPIASPGCTKTLLPAYPHRHTYTYLLLL